MGAASENLTERQKKWFATVQANLESKTGKPLDEWVTIARTCPHTTSGKQAGWLKENYGLGVNHASYVLWKAFPSDQPGWDDPAALRAQLWKDDASHAILQALEQAVADLPGLVVGQRKGYTSFSKDVQFAAARPLKGGKALLGLKLEPAASPRLSAPTRKESWSERLTGVVELASPADVDADVKALLGKAWERG